MTTRARGRITWRGKLLLAVLAPLLLLSLLEIGLRVAGFKYEGAASPLESGVRTELLEHQVYEKDPELLWTLRRSTYLNIPVMGFPGVKTTAEGLRGLRLPGPRAPDEFRVLCLGDSVTFCLGLPDGKTWPERMKVTLRRTPGFENRKVTVVNGGVPGWSSVQGLRLLARLSDLEPDLIVFWFGMNDASPARGVPDSVFDPGSAASRVAEALRGLRVYQLVGRVADGLRGPPEAGTRVSPEEFRGAVRQLLELERNGGPPTIFVRAPERLAITAGQLERLAARAEQEGVDLIVGPKPLLAWVMPGPPGCDLTGHRAEWEGRDALLFEGDPENPKYNRIDTYIELSSLREDIRNLHALRRALDTHLRCLPEGSLGYEDLFGDAPPHVVFSDNCHLSEKGARLVGEAVARRAVEILCR